MKKTIVNIVLIIMVTIFLLIKFSNIAHADMGPKPSITIKLKNMTTDNYLIDLLVYDETGEKYKSQMECNGSELTEEQIKTLYNINYDGWISESTRCGTYLLFSDCAGPGYRGDEKYEHLFNYFDTPKTYRILIINNDTGETMISDVINRKNFTSYVTLDVKKMTVKQSGMNLKKSLKHYEIIILPLVITIIVEIIISLIMNLKKYIKLVAITNFITNIILQLVVYTTISSYYNILIFAILEIAVIIAEYLIYKICMKDENKKKILIYTLIANICTALLTFVEITI